MHCHESMFAIYQIRVQSIMKIWSSAQSPRISSKADDKTKNFKEKKSQILIESLLTDTV